MAYTGSIDLISGIRPKNNGGFPLADAKDIYVSDGKRLDAALNEKAEAAQTIPKPAEEGTTGQILRIDEEGTPAWSDVGTPTEEQVGDAVDAWLTAHPEATTTVQDGTITRAKLDADLQEKTDAVPGLEGAVSDLEELTLVIEEETVTTDILGSLTWTSGYMGVNGTTGTSSNMQYSDKIQVSEGDVLTALPATHDFRFICAFSENVAVSDKGAQNVNTYTVPSGVDAVIVTAYTPESGYAPSTINYTTKTVNKKNIYDGDITELTERTSALERDIARIDEAVEETGDAIAELSGTIDDVEASLDTKVDLSGENEVTPQNIEGVTFTKTSEESTGENIFSSNYLFEENYYVNIDQNGRITHSYLAGYKSYCIPVDGESKYTFTNARFACLSKGNTLASEAVGELQSYISEIVTTGANYLFLSYSGSTDFANLEVHKVTTQSVYSDFAMPAWMRNGLDAKPKAISGTGAFTASGDVILLSNARSDLRKGSRIIFEAIATSGTDFDIGFSTSEAEVKWPHNVIGITSSNITYGGSNYPHGLTVSGMIQCVFEYLDDGTAEFTLICNGELYKQAFSFSNSNVAVPYVKSNGLIATNCKLVFTCTDIANPIWIFGDSYVQYSNARWPYYLHEYGYDKKVLINGFPGEGSTNARVAMPKLLAMGTPKFAIWCMGMNDGSDTNASTPSADWVSGRGYFIGYCSANGITPIFATIPTVPTVNNEGKNAWVRASGYRYIDFAKAVGADSSGEWYTGMLSSDGVHPSETGAKALFAQVLLEFPEIMLN